MTDGTPTRAQRFAAVVVPHAERAGYTGHGAKARFARDTGMAEASVTRLWQGKALPEVRFYDAIAQAVGVELGTLLIEGEFFHPKLFSHCPKATDRRYALASLRKKQLIG